MLRFIVRKRLNLVTSVSEKGASTSEYATLVALLMVAILPSIHFVTDGTTNSFQQVGHVLGASSLPGHPPHGGPTSSNPGFSPSSAHSNDSADSSQDDGTQQAFAPPADPSAMGPEGGGTHGTIENTDDGAPASGQGNNPGPEKP